MKRIARSISNKLVRDLRAHRYLKSLGTMPCGCTPRLAVCGCPPTQCECPLEIVLCKYEHFWGDDEAINVPQEAIDHWGFWDQAPEASELIDARLWTMYAELDPDNYRILPTPDKPLTVISRSAIVETMTARLAAGLSPFNPGADLSSATLKTGCTIVNGRNGAAHSQDLHEEPS